ncbi:nuclear transport factor 2 family protein [Amphritea opalescens]|uniref:Nuclear transport factor 2 family protein n=1 Tax=Amphritea opalescens TaxID=2490544 RepID=A0A430KP42_9GAMM|nr:nuclear transport factor 2 family protein [Amphritea opalescens]RTE65279.1 nuclear transport factor 2 family protein [Amphritea opalescens]
MTDSTTRSTHEAEGQDRPNPEGPIATVSYTERLNRYALLLSQLTAANVVELDPLVSETIYFTDPFNRLKGKANFLGLMSEMFEQLNNVSFEVFETQIQGQTGYLYWRFSASSSLTGAFSTEGTSRVCFNHQGLVVSHQDFWDASALIEQFPLLGRIIRYIRRRAAYKA